MVDLYVWFRWKTPDIDPAKTMEFMNRFTSDDNVREALYDQPKSLTGASTLSSATRGASPPNSRWRNIRSVRSSSRK